MAEPSFNLGDGNWAGKSGNLLGYHKIDNNFYADELTFTRASSGTIVNAEGLIESVASGIPRVDYLTNTNGSLLLEPQRTNLITYSEDLSNWSSENVTNGSNVTTSPDGTQNADTIIDSATTTRHINYESFSGNLATERTLSVYAKQNNLRYLFLSVTNSGDSNCYSAIFDLQSGIVSATKVNGTATNSASIISIGDGWYRCIISGTMTTATDSYFSMIGTSDRSGFTGSLQNNNAPIYTGSSQSIYLWGAQLEEGSYATSYIPTSGTTVTRLQDTSSTTGLSSVIGQTEGTMYIDFTYKGLEDVNNMTSLSDGGVSNRVQLNISSSGIGALIVSNGVTSFTSSNTSLVVGNRYKVAVKYKVNDFALWINGTETSTDTLGDVPLNLNRFSFAFTNGTAFHFNQTVSASLLYKTALTNTELATLTT